MLILDAIFACLVLRYLSDNAVLALCVMAVVTFLRLAPKLNRLLDIIEHSIVLVDYEENEEENNVGK